MLNLIKKCEPLLFTNVKMYQGPYTTIGNIISDTELEHGTGQKSFHEINSLAKRTTTLPYTVLHLIL